MAKKKEQPPSNEKLLKNWNVLNAWLTRLGELRVAMLLEEEKAGKNRLTFTLRLHSRLSVLRRERERRDLAGSAGKSKEE